MKMESMPVAQERPKNKEAVLREMLPYAHEAYLKAEKMMREAAIDPRNFVHPYGEDVVNKDIAWTEKMLKRYENDGTDFNMTVAHAEIVEAILYEHIEQSNWFGENVSTIKTSKFDDIRNGVDLIVEFEEEKNALLHMGLAVDVTFGEKSLQDKIRDIKSDIERGKLSEIKYFESERSPHKGLYQRLPRVVVGIDRGHMFDLMKMWVDNTRKKEFANHPVQAMILHEITGQLACFEQYAEKCGQHEIAAIYHKEGMLIRKIMRQKGEIAGAGEYEQNDGVHNGIKKQLELF